MDLVFFVVLLHNGGITMAASQNGLQNSKNVSYNDLDSRLLYYTVR
jgi:hypothetical protein